MNKYTLGKQKTLAELCEKKDEKIKELVLENTLMKELLESLVYWNEQGSIDEAYWVEAEKLSKL